MHSSIERQREQGGGYSEKETDRVLLSTASLLKCLQKSDHKHIIPSERRKTEKQINRNRKN